LIEFKTICFVINDPAASGRGMKDPTHKAKKVSPQAAGNLTLKRLKYEKDKTLHANFDSSDSIFSLQNK
jgi:hypothetical protein